MRMIREFIYKYYIDPIRYGEQYNVVDTLTYAGVLIIAVYAVWRWLKQNGVAIDRTFVIATMPYVVLGGVLRVVQDTGMITSDLQFLLVTPLIYFVLFFFCAGMLFLARYLQRKGLVDSYAGLYGLTGAIASLVVTLLILSFGAAHTRVDFGVLFFIAAMACGTAAVVWGCMRYLLRWEYVANPLYVILILGHMLDASATSYGIDFHPVTYVEQHVIGSNLIAFTGTAFVMFPLKFIVLFLGVYILELYRREAEPDLWHLILLAMIVVGFAPGIRDMMRMVIYV